MGEHARKSDGRRIFSPDFKRETVQRLNSGEITLAELSRDLDIAQQVIRNWKRRFEEGATTAVGANEDVVPASELRASQQRIRELERALGRKTMEVEIPEAARDVVKKVPGCAKGPFGDRSSGGSHLSNLGNGQGHGLSRCSRTPQGVRGCRAEVGGAAARAGCELNVE